MKRFSGARWLLVSLIPLLAGLTACNNDDNTTNNNTYTPNKTNGEYLVKHVAVCGDCHTPMDATGTPIASKFLAGGNRFALDSLGQNVVYTRNLTNDSTGILDMTDDQVVNAIRTGIAVHTMAGMTMTDTLMVMPYPLYANLTDHDVRDIVAYLRSVTPVKNSVPPDTLHFPRSLAPKITLPTITSPDTIYNRGHYLATIGGCNDCHTPGGTSGNPDMTRVFAGGNVFNLGPLGIVYTLNITQDSATGIGGWTDAQIKKALTEGIDDEGQKLCPPMPWQAFSGMTTYDIDAVIKYLRSVKAVNNAVPKKTAHC
jgi:mono/diheme cytochrome c family protein